MAFLGKRIGKRINGIRRAKFKTIIGLGMVLIGISSLVFPLESSVRLYFEGFVSGYRIGQILGGMFLAFGGILSWMSITNRPIDDWELRTLCSPITLLCVWSIMTYLANPAIYRYSPVVPVVISMLAWLITSYTLNGENKKNGF